MKLQEGDDQGIQHHVGATADPHEPGDVVPDRREQDGPDRKCGEEQQSEATHGLGAGAPVAKESNGGDDDNDDEDELDQDDLHGVCPPQAR